MPVKGVPNISSMVVVCISWMHPADADHNHG